MNGFLDFQKKLEVEILRTLRNKHPEPQTAARIAYYINNRAYLEKNDRAWNDWKNTIRIQLKIMWRNELINRGGFPYPGYYYIENKAISKPLTLFQDLNHD